MTVDEKDPSVAIVTLEEPDSLGAFKAGMIDHRQWSRHPETNALANYINDNIKFSQIVVKSGNGYVRVR
jgi:hypothetical protein